MSSEVSFPETNHKILKEINRRKYEVKTLVPL